MNFERIQTFLDCLSFWQAVWLFPLAFVLTQSALCNALFHIGATAVFGVYSPGVITSLTLYPAIFYYLSCLAYRERLLKDKDGILSLAIAGAIHIVVVATQVFLIKLV